MEELKITLEKYKIVSDQLNDVNTAAKSLRDQKKGIELELMDILKDRQFEHINKIGISSDGSMIKIDRNVTKAWHISKTDLAKLLESYFRSTNNPKYEECCNYVISHQTEKLKSEDFEFTRTFPKKVD